MALRNIPHCLNSSHHPSNRETAMLDYAMASPGFRPVWMPVPTKTLFCFLLFQVFVFGGHCRNLPVFTVISTGTSSVTVARLRRIFTGLPFHGKTILPIILRNRHIFNLGSKFGKNFIKTFRTRRGCQKSRRAFLPAALPLLQRSRSSFTLCGEAREAAVRLEDAANVGVDVNAADRRQTEGRVSVISMNIRSTVHIHRWLSA